MNDCTPWQRRLRERVGLPAERSQWPEALRALPADLDSASLTLPFSLPLLTRARQRLEAGQRRVVIGLNGPVGVGKSTLAGQLLRLAPRFGFRLTVASIDDAYRPLAERRQRLAGNPFGVSRVPPGSHDIPLLLEALDRWRQAGSLRLPRFNKSLMAGEGERDGWSESEAEVLVLEGWLIGCRPLEPEHLQQGLTQLSANRSASGARGGSGAGSRPWLTPSETEAQWILHWNEALRDYTSLWDQLDALWLLRPTAWTLPRRWRLQAEASQRKAGGGWLCGKDLEALVRSSLLSLPPQLYQDPLLGCDRINASIAAEAVAVLDGQRRCRWCGLTTDWPIRIASGDQLSSDSASSATG